MLDTHALVAYSSAFLETSGEETELKQRLSLYQVFLRLYDHNRSLLDEILSLENSSSKALGLTRSFMQGAVINGQVCLITNLVDGRTQALTQPDHIWTIGRDPHQVLIPICDSRLSRCHAVIRYASDQQFYLTDLGSSNGSFVNGERVRQCLRLRDGDRIRLGTLTFIFYVCQVSKPLKPISAAMMSQLTEAGSLPQSAVTQPAPAKSTEPPAGAIADPSQHPLPPDDTLQFMRPEPI